MCTQDQDALWAVVFATAPGTVTLYTSDTAKQTFQVTAGVNKLSMPLTPGGYMRGTLARGGQTVVDLKPAGYTFTANPQTYNYNAFTAFSSGTGGAAPAPAPAFECKCVCGCAGSGCVICAGWVGSVD